jgi:aminoglycoside 6'-N-acetyltransferase I
MRIEAARAVHDAAWRALRVELWPEAAADGSDLDAWLATHGDRYEGFIAFDDDGTAIGFAEASLRSDYVNGCDTSPVLFLEGLYVRPARRRRGVARALCEAVAQWGRARGCCEFASDTLLDNALSQAVHRALGFAEVERVVYFRKPL